ncbi:hypothetical protein K1719_043240 [Acacia pycnantha]|nr:hypothetical protein K1719_043240 [Acacia pycnantha]
MECILSLRFFIFQYGIVYHLNVARGEKSIAVYSLSLLVIMAVMVILMIVSLGKKKLSVDSQLMFRLQKFALFVGVIVILVLMFVLMDLIVGHIFARLLAFMPIGWALVQIAQACMPVVENRGLHIQRILAGGKKHQ